MKKIYVILMGLIVLLFFTFIILTANGEYLSLKFANLGTENITIISKGIDDNGKNYQVLEFYETGKGYGFAYLTQNNIGVWNVNYSETAVSEDTGMITMSWMKTAGIRRFSFEDNPIFETEAHVLYRGNNAVKLIELSHLLPDNVSVNIQQAGSEYLLHFVSFSDADLLSALDVHKLLLSSESVKTSN